MTSRIGLGPYPLTAAALLLALVAPAAAAPSSGTDQDTALCERAIVQGAQRGGLPTEVLESISLAETGRLQDGKLRPWPWAINREGQGYWFASRDQALAFARQSLAEGRTSFDVGCFQINYRWHGQAFPSLEAMFDPDQGADFAARFLRDLYAEFGSWSGAAGAYHSRTPELASDYSARFDRILASVGNAPPLVVADAAPAPCAGHPGPQDPDPDAAQAADHHHQPGPDLRGVGAARGRAGPGNTRRGGRHHRTDPRRTRRPAVLIGWPAPEKPSARSESRIGCCR